MDALAQAREFRIDAEVHPLYSLCIFEGLTLRLDASLATRNEESSEQTVRQLARFL